MALGMAKLPFGLGMGEGPGGAAAFGGGDGPEAPSPAKLGRRPAAPACGRARFARPPPPPSGPFAHIQPAYFTFYR